MESSLAEQHENLVLEHLRALRKDLGDVKSEMRTMKAETATKSDLHSLRADVASDLIDDPAFASRGRACSPEPTDLYSVSR